MFLQKNLHVRCLDEFGKFSPIITKFVSTSLFFCSFTINSDVQMSIENIFEWREVDPAHVKWK